MSGNNNLLDDLHNSGQEPNGGGAGNPPTPPPPTPPSQAGEGAGGEPTVPPTPQIPPTEPVTVNPWDVFGDEYKEKKWDDVKSDYLTKAERLSVLEKELEAAKQASPKYANETVAAYDAWVKNGGVDDFRVFGVVKNFKDDMDNIDALVAKQIIENPHFVGFEDMLKEKLIEEYKIEATEENGLSEKQVEFNKAQLSSEALKAKQFLSEQKGKLQVTQAPNNALTEENLAKRKTDWGMATSKVLSTAKSLSIPVAKVDGDATKFEDFMNFQVPETIINKYQQEFTDAYASFTDVSEEAVNQLKGQAYQRMIAENLPFIIKAAIDKKEAEMTEAYDKKYAGYVLKDPGSFIPRNSGVKTSGDEHMESLLNS